MAPKETGQVSWVVRDCALRFTFGGFRLLTLELPTLDLNVPFHQLLGKSLTPPPPSRFPPGVRSQRMLSYPVESRLPRICRERGYIRYVPHHYDRYWVEIKSTFSDYLLKFSSKTRNSLSRKMRRFALHSGGEIRWRRYTTSAEMPEFHALASEVSAKSYQGRLLDTGIPATDEFRQDLCRRALDGEIRGFVLFLGDRPIAYNLSSVRGTAVEYEFPGFDPAFMELSPGTVLLLITLESIFGEKRFTAFDFGPGDLEYKRRFATGHAPCAEIYYFRATLANAALILLHTIVNVGSDYCKKLLGLLKIRERLRRFVHYRLRFAV
jgi:hypothetical protein